MTLPLQFIDLTGIGEGGAIMIVGLLGITLWAAVKLRNPLGMVMWGLSAISLVLVGMLEIRPELFWLGLVLTLVLVVIGAVARMSGGR